jgi:penicillin G amidase
MITGLLVALTLQTATTIQHDDFGVAHVIAASAEEAYRGEGYAVAEDRLWQMENSRRLARGKLSEIFGSSTIASDREVLTNGYTDEELQQQVDHLPYKLQAAFKSYADGVNAYIRDAGKAGNLPAEYAKYQFMPEPWTELDSAAIASNFSVVKRVVKCVIWRSTAI